MKLTLRYKENHQQKISAALIKRAQPEDWLFLINQWGVDPESLICFLLPKSLKSVEADGLFVIFPQNIEIPTEQIIYPFSQIGEKLFIPLQSEIFPPVFKEELAQFLLWEYQIFHPQKGLIGFSREDKVDFSQLIQLEEKSSTIWNLAREGQLPWADLEEIIIPQPTPEEIIQQFQETIGTEDISNIPDDDDESELGGFFRDLGINSLKGALSASQKLRDWLDEEDDNETIHSGGGTGSPEWGGNFDHSPGLLDRFENWASNRLDDLINQRNKEIDRLMELFKNNPEEALKYALPLDSKYLDRGKARPSSKLSQRDTEFNLRNIGGGAATDGWNLPDDQYFKLRQLYQDQAQACLDNQDYRKAAYIYAHLLGEFHMAANALEQGNYYREAAVMYKEHLRKPDLAAACLEKGGLYPEAIDIYIELNQYEKAGDLSVMIGRTQKARKYYSHCYEEAINRDDYLDAVRILEEKLEELENVGDLLLEGWDKSSQHNACLQKYFDQYPKENEEAFAEEVNHIFEKRTPQSKKDLFLDILIYTKRKYPSHDLEKTSEEIAFQVVSKNISKGKLNNIEILGQFLDKDKLIKSDISRYKYYHKKYMPKRKMSEIGKPSQISPLPKDVTWQQMIGFRNRFFAVGMANNRLYIARGNRNGLFQSYSWGNKLPSNTKLRIFADPGSEYKIVLYNDQGGSFEKVTLTETSVHPYNLEIIPLNWLSEGISSIGFSINYLSTLAAPQSVSQITKYSYEGQARKNYLVNNNQKLTNLYIGNQSTPQLMHYHEEHFYTCYDQYVLKIQDQGEGQGNISSWAAPGMVLNHSISHHPIPLLAVSSEGGCLLLSLEKSGFRQIGEVFARDFEVVDLGFVSDNLLVLAGRNDIYIYNIDNRQETPQLAHQYQVRENIQSLVSSYVRGQITAFTENGDLVFY